MSAPSLPAMPWLGYDPELGNLHGFSHEDMQAAIAAAARQQALINKDSE